MEHVDVIIVGAGLSGICAAYYIQTKCPQKSFTVLEGREALGGTWDLFRYPGIRSDSDMYTLGYTFHPWRNAKAIADGESILSYINEVADTYNLRSKIRLQHKVCGAEWSSEKQQWTVSVQQGENAEITKITCQFIYFCMGYYRYEQGYTPQWAGMERFKGRMIHPQHWDKSLDYTNKEIIIIGSGATAVTLAPALSDKAKHITLLQRTPSYVITLPAEDKLANWMNRTLPIGMAYTITRWKVILLNMVFYILSRARPSLIKGVIKNGVKQALGKDYDVDTHFNPPYNPWDQRLCMVPDNDLFEVIKSGKVTMVTDHIETFTENGIRLKSGKELVADIIITATGLVMQVDKAGQLTIDGKTLPLNQTMSYRGTMMSDIPNVAFAIGYTNASWTLKCELSSKYVCRLLNHMDAKGYKQAIPRQNDPSVGHIPIMDFTSGYVKRALTDLPSQGTKLPWKLYQNFILDKYMMVYNNLDDGVLEFK
jgi:monooxygenase